VLFNNVDGAMVRNSRAQAKTGTFLQVAGERAGDIAMGRNDLRQAKVEWELGQGAQKDIVRAEGG
jgi:hypothetical protein